MGEANESGQDNSLSEPVMITRIKAVGWLVKLVPKMEFENIIATSAMLKQKRRFDLVQTEFADNLRPKQSLKDGD